MAPTQLRLAIQSRCMNRTPGSGIGQDIWEDCRYLEMFKYALECDESQWQSAPTPLPAYAFDISLSAISWRMDLHGLLKRVTHIIRRPATLSGSFWHASSRCAIVSPLIDNRMNIALGTKIPVLTTAEFR